MALNRPNHTCSCHSAGSVSSWQRWLPHASQPLPGTPSSRPRAFRNHSPSRPLEALETLGLRCTECQLAENRARLLLLKPSLLLSVPKHLAYCLALTSDEVRMPHVE